MAQIFDGFGRDRFATIAVGVYAGMASVMAPGNLADSSADANADLPEYASLLLILSISSLLQRSFLARRAKAASPSVRA